MTKKRSIKPYTYLSSNNSTLKFENGTLVQAKAIIDETVIPTTVISSLVKIAVATAAVANSGIKKAEQDTMPAPYLFRIVQKDDVWTLAAERDDGIRIRYMPEAAK